MRLSGAAWFRTANDIVHDIAAGAWPGMVVGMWIVRRGIERTLGAEVTGELALTWTWVLAVAAGFAVVQVVTGALRLDYRYHGIPEEVHTIRGRIALAKHAVFVTTAVLSLFLAFAVLQA